MIERFKGVNEEPDTSRYKNLSLCISKLIEGIKKILRGDVI